MLPYILFISALLTLKMFEKVMDDMKKNKFRKNTNLVVSYNNTDTNKSFSKNNQLITIAGVLIISLSALRFEIGWDYAAYLKSLIFRNTDADIHLTSRGEPLNLILMEFSQYIEMPSFYFITTSIIINSLIITNIKKYSTNPWISLFIFIGFPLFYLNSFSVIRNFVGISIVLHSMRYIVEKNLLKFIIGIITAGSFHTSGYIAILLYPLYHLKSNIYIYSLISAIILSTKGIIGTITERYLPQYQNYTETISSSEGTIAIYPLVFTAIIGILLRQKIPKISNGIKTDGLLNIYIFGVIFYIAFIEFGSIGHRLTLYFTTPLIFIIPLIMESISGKIKSFASFFVYIISIISFFFTINIAKEAYLPYKTIFSNI